MVRFVVVNVLAILATVYMVQCFLHFDGFHHYDKYHLYEMIKLLRSTCTAAQEELRMIFANDKLTKQELNDTIRNWSRKTSLALQDAIVENLDGHQQKIMEMQRNIEKSANVSLKMQNALLKVLKIKANMSLTNLQERQQIEQFMRSFNRTDRIRLHILLRQTLLKQLKQQRFLRSIHKINRSVSDEEGSDGEVSDEISAEHEQFISCKLHCNSTDQCNFERLNLNVATKDDLMGVMKNYMDEDERAKDGRTEPVPANINEY
ncbi:unnamed protein product [Litomosoides sigmodontis]|uniref:SXP/RAL-2 family protein Ani s 5-like cation-binding domain-containing protein n=1 Tax=Litomosoides sigmodontis TaxID=42156 RepID=A0A3P6UQP8_LITSI|nr:unnamed protein product [Litomosoides sigmodontis]